MTSEAEAVLLGLVGEVVGQLRFDFALTIVTDSGWWIVIESGGAYAGVTFSPGAYADVAGPLTGLNRRAISSVRLTDAHDLELAFDGARALTATIDPEYDSWHVVAPDGRRVHVESGGRVVVFDGSAAPATRQ